MHTFWNSLFCVPSDVIKREHVTTQISSQTYGILNVTFPLEVNDDVLLWVVPVNGTVRTAPRHYIVPMLPIGDKSEEKYPSNNACKHRPTASFFKGGGLIQKRPYFKLPKILKILIRGRGGGQRTTPITSISPPAPP